MLPHRINGWERGKHLYEGVARWNLLSAPVVCEEESPRMFRSQSDFRRRSAEPILIRIPLRSSNHPARRWVVLRLCTRFWSLGSGLLLGGPSGLWPGVQQWRTVDRFEERIILIL